MTGPLFVFEERGPLAPDPDGPDAVRARGVARVEAALQSALDEALGSCPGAANDSSAAARAVGPPRLRAAVTDAVFGGGSRLRPSLCVAVAAAHGDPDPAIADRAAAAVEFMHCASLVHDDLPCFDDASLRRGRPTIHAAHGVSLAVLAGDALIVLAFQTLARSGEPRSLAVLADASGPSRGIVAGQAWEDEPSPPLDEYHRAKTASLFVAAARLGALAAGADDRPWITFGDAIGRAYQAHDDLLDTLAGPAITGKTGGRDAALGRPSVVRSLGATAARQRVERLVQQASRALPPCSDESPVRAWLARFDAKLRASAG